MEQVHITQILKPLVEKLEPQSRINVRRGQLFMDYMEVRKRCCWIKPENKLKVVFVGEPAEDLGGPRREFLTGILYVLISYLMLVLPSVMAFVHFVIGAIII